MTDLEKKIEAILFWKGEPVSLKRLAEILIINQSEVKEAIDKLKLVLEGRGVVLQENDGEVALGTSPEYSSLIEGLQKEELNRDLSKASLETLSIILYKNGASRSEIENIRGVNSSFTLRALSMRGLVEKVSDPDDSRRYKYKPSLEILSYLGLKSIEELPGYGEINNTINKAEKSLAETMLNHKEEPAKDLKDGPSSI